MRTFILLFVTLVCIEAGQEGKSSRTEVPTSVSAPADHTTQGAADAAKRNEEIQGAGAPEEKQDLEQVFDDDDDDDDD